MTYKERAEKAHSQGQAVRISEDIRKLKEGEVLIGVFKGRNLIKSNKSKMPDFYRYHFDTDEGPMATTFGQVFDAREGALLEVHALYEITCKGQRDIGGGKKVNLYPVMLLEVPASGKGASRGEDNEKDLPF